MALELLASVDDLEARLTTGALDDRAGRAEVLLADASAAVRNYTGQQFTVGTSTAALVRPRSGVARLPQRPVTAITAVVDLNDTAVTYTWIDGDDRLYIGASYLNEWELNLTGNRVNAVKVTYEHGYDEMPGEIIAIVCQVAARSLGRSPEDSGMQQEAIAGYSYTVGSVGASGAVGFLAEEKRVLDSYRTPEFGSIRVGP